MMTKINSKKQKAEKASAADMRKTIIKTMAFTLLNKDIKEKDVERIEKIFNRWKSNLKYGKYKREEFFKVNKISADDKLIINAILDTATCSAIVLYT